MFLVLFCSILVEISEITEIQLVCDRRMDGRMDERMDRQTDGRTHPLIEMQERI